MPRDFVPDIFRAPALKGETRADRVRYMDKPCPACGGRLRLLETVDDNTYMVGCESCSRGGVVGNTPGDANPIRPELEWWEDKNVITISVSFEEE